MNRPPLWRRFSTILAVIGAAVVVDFSISTWQAASVPRPGSDCDLPFRQLVGSARSQDGGSWAIHRLPACTKRRVISSWQMGEAVGDRLQAADFLPAWAGLSALDSPGTSTEQLRHATGWPFPSWVGGIDRTGQAFTIVTAISLDDIEDGLDINWECRVLPMRPWLPGLLGNSALYAIPIWIVVSYIRDRRRLARVARGHCPSCSRDLETQVQECPECGRRPADSGRCMPLHRAALVGVAVSVAVVADFSLATWRAASAPKPGSACYWPMPIDVGTASSQDRGFWHVYSMPECSTRRFYIESVQGGAAAGERLAAEQYLPAWTGIHAVDLPGTWTQQIRHASGWPFPSWVGGLDIQQGAITTVTAISPDRASGMPESEWRIIPLRPWLPGLLANALLVYTIPVLVFIGFVRTRRRLRRLKRGHCPSCRYDMRIPMCPDCSASPASLAPTSAID